MQLILNAEADEYIQGRVPSVGFTIIIHETGTDIYEGEIVGASVNRFTSVRMKKVRLYKKQFTVYFFTVFHF